MDHRRQRRRHLYPHRHHRQHEGQRYCRVRQSCADRQRHDRCLHRQFERTHRRLRALPAQRASKRHRGAGQRLQRGRLGTGDSGGRTGRRTHHHAILPESARRYRCPADQGAGTAHRLDGGNQPPRGRRGGTPARDQHREDPCRRCRADIAGQHRCRGTGSPAGRHVTRRQYCR